MVLRQRCSLKAVDPATKSVSLSSICCASVFIYLCNIEFLYEKTLVLNLRISVIVTLERGLGLPFVARIKGLT